MTVTVYLICPTFFPPAPRRERSHTKWLDEGSPTRKERRPLRRLSRVAVSPHSEFNTTHRKAGARKSSCAVTSETARRRQHTEFPRSVPGLLSQSGSTVFFFDTEVFQQDAKLKKKKKRHTERQSARERRESEAEKESAERGREAERQKESERERENMPSRSHRPNAPREPPLSREQVNPLCLSFCRPVFLSGARVGVYIGRCLSLCAHSCGGRRRWPASCCTRSGTAVTRSGRGS